MGVKRQHISNQLHRFTSLKWYAKVWWVSILGYNKCLLCSLGDSAWPFEFFMDARLSKQTQRHFPLNFLFQTQFCVVDFSLQHLKQKCKMGLTWNYFCYSLFFSVFKIWSNLISLFAPDIQSINYVLCSGPKQIDCGHKLKQWATWNWNIVTILLTAPQKYGATLAFTCSWAPAHLTTLQ